MADGLADIRREIMVLPLQEKATIAREALRSLDPEDRENIASEFAKSPEVLQYKQRFNITMLGVAVFILTIGALVGIVLSAPAYLDVLLPVFTSILGTVVGFLFGQQGPSRPG